MSRSPAILPSNLQDALHFRSIPTACRRDIEDAMAKIPFFGQEKPQNRFTNLSNSPAPEGWRMSKHEDEEWTSVRKRPAPYKKYTPHHSYTDEKKESREVKEGIWRSSRFKPIEETVESNIEDRIMGKVRAKINKIGHSTYDATKSFMQQILDSGEREFLEEFMRFVFQKAATETAFCALYARLLHELADEFEHLRYAMIHRFREYSRVFDEVSASPDVGTADYAAFVESQAQKKFRRGYSQFIAELAKLGEVSMADFQLVVEKIVETLESCYIKEDHRLLCEELVDCFLMMWKANPTLFQKQAWVDSVVEKMRSIVGASRESAPGLSNKAKFGLMDILDLATKTRK